MMLIPYYFKFFCLEAYSGLLQMDCR
jgi:hypothetical protein